MTTTEISKKGKQIKVKSAAIDNREIIVTGNRIKIARIKGEQWFEKEYPDNPDYIIKEIGKSNLKPDIFTFSQSIHKTKPEFNYYYEYDNYAVVQINNYDEWKKQIARKARQSITKSERKGVIVKSVEFTDDLIRGIVDIYNETPFRQGRRFWHYGKGFENAKKENSNYLEISEFIGAYYNNELIGFIKLVFGKQVASIMQILSKAGHQDKAPTNALLAKAVEICDKKNVPNFIYGNYIYGKKTKSSLIDFKRHNGFVKIDVPRYFIPLTQLGNLALKLNLHRNMVELIPENLQTILLKVRWKWYLMTHKRELQIK